MEIKPIHTEEDYLAALAEIESIFYALPGTPEGDKLEILVTLIEAYEEKHHKIPLPDPIEAIEFHMERLGLTRKDLEPFIGNRARVSEILNRKRPLSIRMIRSLSKGLGIPPEILVQEYPTRAEIVVEEEVELSSLEVMSFWIAFGNMANITTKSSAGNIGEFTRDENTKSWLQNFIRDVKNTESQNDCFFVENPPLIYSTILADYTNNCEPAWSNQAGNSHLQRIIQ